MGIVDKIKELENEYARTQKNKATEGHLGIIKAKLSKLRGELLQDQAGSGGGGEGFAVPRSGDGRVALIGFPSVGKSSLFNLVTEQGAAAANFPFCPIDPTAAQWAELSQQLRRARKKFDDPRWSRAERPAVPPYIFLP